VVQDPPAVPHVAGTCGWHVLFWQHPLGQDAALQTQAPPTQACPCGQAGPDLQTQLPPAAQVSALIPQAEQAPPAAPHARADGVVHV
jgi:hypothetical protein